MLTPALGYLYLLELPMQRGCRTGKGREEPDFRDQHPSSTVPPDLQSFNPTKGSTVFPALCQRDRTVHAQGTGSPRGCKEGTRLCVPSPFPALQCALAALLELLCLLSYLIALLVTSGNEQKIVIAAVSDDVNTSSISPHRLAKSVPGRAVIYGDPQPRSPRSRLPVLRV